ncbi:Retinol-binding protein 1 [Varanus komodoensis]|nr:Retinol-binding protein 1 [Varanus komodoensis]
MHNVIHIYVYLEVSPTEFIGAYFQMLTYLYATCNKNVNGSKKFHNHKSELVGGKDSFYLQGPLVRGLRDVNIAVRKIASMLKPDKEIIQDGDHMIIRTLSTFKNYIMDFEIGKEFEEDLTGLDDRKCMTCVTWDGDKLLCVQKGEKEGRGWTQWIEGDEMHLEIRACGVKCKQVFKKVH